jgi:hypothetical protein
VDATPPLRPRTFDRYDLGFTRRRPVAWLAPENLAWLDRISTGVGRGFIDTRLTYARHSASVRDYSEAGDLWVDYLAGTGDGFDATYTVAWAVAQRSLAVDGVDEALPRGNVLIIGGDLVQPAASYDDYVDRLTGPFRAALPWTVSDHPAMYALPGASDWVDGLDNFGMLFTQNRWFGGWMTNQARSYFGLRLPHRWWLWGLDLKEGSQIDGPQLEYFLQVAEHMKPGDRVIMCFSPPLMYGTAATTNTAAAFVERTVLRPYGANVALYLTGRGRYYVRYQSGDPEEREGVAEEFLGDDLGYSQPPICLVNCGTGGSYTSGTNHLPHEVVHHVDRDDPSDFQEARLVKAYPSRRRSRQLALTVLMRVITANPGFAVLLGGMHLALMLSLVGVPNDINGPAVILVATALVAVMAPGQFGSLSDMLHRATTFGVPMQTAGWGLRVFAGINVLAQVGLALVGASIWRDTAFPEMSGWWPLVAAVGLYAPVAAVAGSMLSAATLLCSGLFGIHVEALYAVAAIQDGKSFLRMHFSTDGQLTVYALGIDRVPEDWRADPDSPDPEASWVTSSRGDPRVRLVDVFTFSSPE